MMILSHPRSGATEFIRMVSDALSDNHINLGEFLHWGDVATSADLKIARDHFSKNINAEPITVKVAEIKNTNEIDWLISFDSQIDRTYFFTFSDKTFSNFIEVDNFCFNEWNKRIQFLEQSKQSPNHFIFKNFITGFFSEKILPDNRLCNLVRKVSDNYVKEDYILYFRKNLYQTTMSNLIKTYYIDRRFKNLDANGNAVMSDAYRIKGHNYKGQMLPIEPEPIEIDPNLVHTVMAFFINLLDHLYDNYDAIEANHSIVTYEDVFEKKSFQFNYNGNLIKVENANNYQHVEFPMNYSTDKQNYFTNSHIVEEIIGEYFQKHIRYRYLAKFLKLKLSPN